MLASETVRMTGHCETGKVNLKRTGRKCPMLLRLVAGFVSILLTCIILGGVEERYRPGQTGHVREVCPVFWLSGQL